MTQEYKSDCFYFRGHVPCVPHKEKGVHCANCPDFRLRKGRILIIKLGAAGDVIRTTPLLAPLQHQYPDHFITWVTEFPSLLPKLVDDPLLLNTENVLWLRHTHFDLVINLDKDRQAGALAAEVSADRKIGFTLGTDGTCQPITTGHSTGMVEAVQNKFQTGLFDDVNKACTQSYPQEIFAICGYEFQGEEYIVERPDLGDIDFDLPEGKALVGLNTGCGGRWTSRLWPEKYWSELARNLQEAGYGVVLLGGPEEHEKNLRLAYSAGVKYPGHFNLPTFIGLMDQCDLVVSAVTMAMHIALGLGKKLVLFNNIFNPHEFELYGRGIILSPEQECTCFFKPRCSAENFCLESLKPAAVQQAVDSLLAKK